MRGRLGRGIILVSVLMVTVAGGLLYLVMAAVSDEHVGVRAPRPVRLNSAALRASAVENLLDPVEEFRADQGLVAAFVFGARDSTDRGASGRFCGWRCALRPDVVWWASSVVPRR